MDSVSVDACCVINLYAARTFLQAARGIRLTLYVSAASAKESLCYHERDGEDEVVVPIDLSEESAPGIIRTTDVANEQETEKYVEFARDLDDGEAMSLAIAFCRGWSFGSDDAKACRIARGNGVHVISTPELVKLLAELAPLKPKQLADGLRRIERNARFVPRQNHPLRAWWNSAREAGNEI